MCEDHEPFIINFKERHRPTTLAQTKANQAMISSTGMSGFELEPASPAGTLGAQFELFSLIIAQNEPTSQGEVDLLR